MTKRFRRPFSRSTLDVAKDILSNKSVRHDETRLAFISIWVIANKLLNLTIDINAGKEEKEIKDKAKELIKIIPTMYNLPLEIRIPEKYRGDISELAFRTDNLMNVEGYTNWDNYNNDEKTKDKK